MKKFGKKLLEGFCQGFECVTDLPFFFPIFIGTIIALATFAFGMALRDESKNETQLANDIAFLESACRKIGTSVDRDRNAYNRRMIYQCPDGQIHIR